MFTCTLEGPCSFCTWARVFIAPRYRRLELSCNRAIWRTNAGETALALWYHAAKSASCSSTSTHKEATRSDSNTSRGVGFSPASSRAMRRALSDMASWTRGLLPEERFARSLRWVLAESEHLATTSGASWARRRRSSWRAPWSSSSALSESSWSSCMRSLVPSGSSITPPHPPLALVSVISGCHQLRHSEDFHSLVELASRRCEASSLVQFGTLYSLALRPHPAAGFVGVGDDMGQLPIPYVSLADPPTLALDLIVIDPISSSTLPRHPLILSLCATPRHYPRPCNYRHGTTSGQPGRRSSSG